MNKNKNTIYQDGWDAEKAVLRGKLTVIKGYIKIEKNLKEAED